MEPKTRRIFFGIISLIFVLSTVWIGYDIWTGPAPWLTVFLLIASLLIYRNMFRVYKTYSPVIDDYTLNVSIPVSATQRMTPEIIRDLLGKESVINAIRNDLSKTRQIGYREVWRLGLLTPDQDRFDPRPDHLSRPERLKKMLEDKNYSRNLDGQIPVKRTAVLHSTNYFGTQFNNLFVTGGTEARLIRAYPGWSYGLKTRLNRGEFIPIRHIEIETDSPSARNRSPFLTRFLQEDGFPIRDVYLDGDPLTTERGGTIVNDHGKILIIHPR